MIPDAGQCRWIDGDPRQPGWTYCGAEAVAGGEGRVWCRVHRALVYRPPSPAEHRDFRRVLINVKRRQLEEAGGV